MLIYHILDAQSCLCTKTIVNHFIFHLKHFLWLDFLHSFTWNGLAAVQLHHTSSIHHPSIFSSCREDPSQINIPVLFFQNMLRC